MFEVTILEDSITQQDIRLVTYQLKYPRYIHAELMTHRVFSRNASSSRAIPTNKLAEVSMTEMVEPIRWGLNQPGMQASEQDLTGGALSEAKRIWKETAETCAIASRKLAELGLHKQWSSRMLEWFGNINVVLSSTEWGNWDLLRNHPDAQPEIHHLAGLMIDARYYSKPKFLTPGQWHLPYITAIEKEAYSLDTLSKVSAARCARVSYLRHDGGTCDVDDDLKLYTRLAGAHPKHLSPTEHQATPDQAIIVGDEVTAWRNQALHGNFNGWCQFRKYIEND